MTFPRCATCRHWKLEYPAEPGKLAWGSCTLTADDGRLTPSQPESLARARSYWTDNGGELDTAATFGCVQHQPKDEQSTPEMSPQKETETMPKVKMLKDTSHPDYGFIERGEVLIVSREYVRDYEALGFAIEVDDDDVTRAVGSPTVTEMPKGMARRKAAAEAQGT